MARSLILLFAAIGCASWLPAPVPMRTVASRADASKQARCLLVLLPGMGDSAEDFADHGFIAAVRARKLSVDTISANATIGYYAQRTVLDRIDVDVLAHETGYSEVWVAGISMGGMGALRVAERHAHDVAGIILIAPFLGEHDVITEISNAGGLPRWQPPVPIDKDDYQRDVWRWIQSATGRPDDAPRIYLASGDRDKLAAGHLLLASVLPKGRVFRTHGTHDWDTWAVLWADVLDHSDFGARCR